MRIGYDRHVSKIVARSVGLLALLAFVPALANGQPTGGVTVNGRPAESQAESTATPPGTPANPDRVRDVLQATGLSFTPVTDRSWSASFQADTLPDVTVVVTLLQEMVLITSTIKEQATLSDAESMAMLRLTFALNYAKIAIDDKGQLVAMNELDVAWLEPAAVRTIVNAVALAANDATEILIRAATSGLKARP